MSETAERGRQARAPAPAARRMAAIVVLPGWSWGLLAALVWGGTPILIKMGLEGVPSPVGGVAVAMLAAAVLYTPAVLARGSLRRGGGMPRRALTYQVVSGLMQGLGHLARWTALSLAPVALVVILSRTQTLFTLAAAPLVLGQELERIDRRVILGTALVLAGTLLVVLYRPR